MLADDQSFPQTLSIERGNKAMIHHRYMGGPRTTYTTAADPLSSPREEGQGGNSPNRLFTLCTHDPGSAGIPAGESSSPRQACRQGCRRSQGQVHGEGARCRAFVNARVTSDSKWKKSQSVWLLKERFVRTAISLALGFLV